MLDKETQEKINETQDKLKKFGYFSSDYLSKIVYLFEESGKKNNKRIPTLLLEGKSGAGKTFLAETFAKMIGADEKYVQCFPRMGTENFQYDVNIEGFMKQDANNVTKPGILLQTLQQSKQGPVVLVIDELDKTRPEVDSFLLDFLENGRLTTGTDTYERGQFPIYTFIISNNKREIDEAIISRSKKVEVPRPNKELFLEILNLPENHYLGYVYDKCPDFSIRQAKQYIDDLEVLGAYIDEDTLSQYINLDDLDVMSLADLQNINRIENSNLEFELPNLEKCCIYINQDNQQSLAKLFENGNNGDFKIYSECNGDKEDLYIDIETVEQLQLLSKYVDFNDSYNGYSGWLEYSLSDEDIQSNNIIWAENKNDKDGTRFGIKIDGDNIFRIAMNKGNVFVYLSSYSSSTIEAFLGNNENIKQDNMEYDNEGRDFND